MTPLEKDHKVKRHFSTEIKRLSDTFIKIYKKTTAKFLTTTENNDERNIFKKCGC